MENDDFTLAEILASLKESQSKGKADISRDVTIRLIEDLLKQPVTDAPMLGLMATVRQK